MGHVLKLTFENASSHPLVFESSITRVHGHPGFEQTALAPHTSKTQDYEKDDALVGGGIASHAYIKTSVTLPDGFTVQDGPETIVLPPVCVAQTSFDDATWASWGGGTGHLMPLTVPAELERYYPKFRLSIHWLTNDSARVTLSDG